MEKPFDQRIITSQTGEEYVPSSKIRSAADIERAAAGVIDVDAKTTTYVVLACVIAASGGVLFGYDGGTTGTGHSSACCTSTGTVIFGLLYHFRLRLG